MGSQKNIFQSLESRCSLTTSKNRYSTNSLFFYKNQICCNALMKARGYSRIKYYFRCTWEIWWLLIRLRRFPVLFLIKFTFKIEKLHTVIIATIIYQIFGISGQLGLAKLSASELCLRIRYLVSEKLLKPPLDRGFFNLVLTIISLKFLWCLKAAFGELVKTTTILSVRGNKWDFVFFIFRFVFEKR